MSSFVVRIKDLHDAGSDFDFPVGVEWLRAAVAGCDLHPASANAASQAGSFRVRVTKAGTNVVVQGAASVVLEATCVRCLSPAPLLIAPRFDLLFTPRPGAPRGTFDEDDDAETEGDGDDHDEADYYNGDDLVLDDVLREHILLEAPMNPVCSAGCEGVRVERTPAPRATGLDPRLTPLLKFQLTKKE